MSQATRQSFFTRRLHIIVVVVFLVAAIIAARLFYLQIVKYSFYRDIAQRQQGFSATLEPTRGEIYFQNSRDNILVTAATTQHGSLLYLDTRSLENADEVFVSLNDITPIDKELFFNIAGKKNDPYEVLKNWISLDESEKIRASNLIGVGLVKKSKRFYPAASLGSHVLGFVSTLTDEPAGKYGIEQYHESSLKGSSGMSYGDKDIKGFLIALGEQFKTDPEEGRNLALTIDVQLQSFVEDQLAAMAEKWDAKNGGIIVVDPTTGSVKALAAVPAFDPNAYFKEEDLSVFLNPFTEKIFELGSVFKPLTMAAAVDYGSLTPETTYTDFGSIKIGSHTISNYDGKARGKRNMIQVLEESLNTGAVFAMQSMGGENLRDYFYRFGFSEKSGIDLPGEVSGDLDNLDSGREVEFATASFGQGVAVTPIEFVMAVSALANGGKLLQPYVVENSAAKDIRNVLKPETSETVTRMLVDVVDTTLAGGNAKIPGYSIAAKTGTAQMPKVDGRGYSDDFLHSFFGYFPAYDPEFLIFLFLERPRGARYASHTLTDPFKATVEFLINYYTVPPDRAGLE